MFQLFRQPAAPTSCPAQEMVDMALSRELNLAARILERQFGERRPFGCSKHLDRLRQLRLCTRRARARERLRAWRSGRSSRVRPVWASVGDRSSSDLTTGPAAPMALVSFGANRVTSSRRIVAREQHITIDNALARGDDRGRLFVAAGGPHRQHRARQDRQLHRVRSRRPRLDPTELADIAV